MKQLKLLQAVLLASNLIGLAACQNPVEGSNTSSESEKEVVELIMQDKTVTYDGKSHGLKIENLPDGATVKYDNNDQTEPGKYIVSANVTLADGTVVNVSAELVIEKMESVLTAEAIQSAIHAGEGATPSYSLNNTEQSVYLEKVYKAGTHSIVLWAPESAHYKESNKIVVNFDVSVSNDLGVEFKSEECLYDGQEKQLLAKNIPDGYTAEYENNKATLQGKYNAVCKIKDAQGNVCLTLTALLEIDNPKNAEFEEYLDEFFADYLGDDYIAWNIFTENPENFGLVRETDSEAKWYYYEPYGENYKQEGYEEMQTYYGYLKEFENAELSYDQKISYKLLDDFFKSNIKYYDPSSIYDPMVNLHYVDQFGGYAADFGTYMEAYSLRNVQDVEDVLSYIKSLPESFATYKTYVSDRNASGYPLSDYTIDEMIGYLDNVTEQGEDYYLGGVIKNHIKETDFLDDDAKGDYCAKVDQYMKDYFMPAYETLATDLEGFKCLCSQEGYLAAYGEVGKAQFEFDLKDLLGMPDLDMEAYGAYLLEKIELYEKKLTSVISRLNNYDRNTYNAFMKFYDRGASIIGTQDPNEMIVYLKKFATTIVPTLEATPEINVKYMDEASAKVSNAVAYYMKSALDSNDAEYITLNGVKLSTNYNDTLSTMAHEGYPGHLYAYLYDKQLNISNVAKIMTSTAHGEGWATYVSLKLFEYLKTNHAFTTNAEKTAIKTYCDYMYYNDLLAYLAYTYIDYMIHYTGWGVQEIKKFMNNIGFNGDAAQEMYRTLIETPTTYAAYGFGMSFYVDLHDNAKKQLGSLYNEIEFNSVILSHGWCSLSELQRITDEYIAETLHLFPAE